MQIKCDSDRRGVLRGYAARPNTTHDVVSSFVREMGRGKQDMTDDSELQPLWKPASQKGGQDGVDILQVSTA